MATLTPVVPTATAQQITPITPGSDVIPCAQFTVVLLILRSTSTSTATITVDDPTSANPAGTLVTAGNFDVTTGTLGAGTVRIIRLDTARFRDASGNINYTTAAAGDAVVYAIGLS